MGVSPQIAAMYLLNYIRKSQQVPARKEQEDPKMQTNRKIAQPQAFKRLARRR